MRKRALSSLTAHVAGCVAVVTAFLWLGVRNIALSPNAGPLEAFHTTDSYLAEAAAMKGGSERLLQVFALLPEKEPIAIVYRVDEDKGWFMAFVLGYFAWPRKLEIFAITPTNAASQFQALEARPQSAAFFCGINAPPGTSPQFPLGDGLVFAPRIAPQDAPQ